MKTLYLDETTKDLIVNNKNNLKFSTTTAEYVSQKIENKLLFFRGEWWLNIDLGIPYYEDILKKNPDLSLIQSIFKNEIVSIQGVSKVISLELELNTATRELTVTFQVESEQDIVEGSIIL